MNTDFEKPSPTDVEAALNLFLLVDTIANQRIPRLSESQGIPNQSIEHFDIENPNHCRRVLDTLIQISEQGSISRSLSALRFMLHPAAELIHPESNLIEPHPKYVTSIVDSERFRFLFAKHRSQSLTDRLRSLMHELADEEYSVACIKIDELRSGIVNRDYLKKWRCAECEALLFQSELIYARSPFSANDILTACPKCKQCSGGFQELCDEQGCMRPTSCGFPTGDDFDQFNGYRRTCHDHSDWKQKK